MFFPQGLLLISKESRLYRSDMQVQAKHLRKPYFKKLAPLDITQYSAPVRAGQY